MASDRARAGWGWGVLSVAMDGVRQDHMSVDAEDWNDVLRKVEVSYAIKFHDQELANVRTLGELLDAIGAKITGREASDCTTQQAFYRIRVALATSLNVDAASITPGTRLEDLFPRKGRRRILADLGTTTGVRLSVFRVKNWITWSLIILLVVSLAAFFWNARAAMLGLGAFTVLTWIARATTKELAVGTIGELAERASQRAYKLMRRNYGTVNRTEVRAKLRSLFQDELGLDEHDLRDDILIV